MVKVYLFLGVVKRRESSEKMVKPFPIIFEGKMGEVQWRATFNIKVKDADTPLDFEPTKGLYFYLYLSIYLYFGYILNWLIGNNA